ncbi:unnamed protein product [Closterium sp. Yama58-4]|nr:unnamed protein product [Closterium sp. Yama58-4]
MASMARLLVTAIALLAAVTAASAYARYTDDYNDYQVRVAKRYGRAWSNQAKAEEARVTQQHNTVKGEGAVPPYLASMISVYLTRQPAALRELMPSAVNTYIALIHVYLAWSTLIDNLTAEMNSKMNSMMLLLQAVKREVEAGRQVSQSELNQGREFNTGLDGVGDSSMEERQVQAEAQEEEGHPPQGLSESGSRLLEEMLEECRMQMRKIMYLREMRVLVELEELEEVEAGEAGVAADACSTGEGSEPWDEQELETWIQFLERVLRENRGVHEEGSERMVSTDGVGARDDEAGMPDGVARSEEEGDGAMRVDREEKADTGGRSGDIKADVAGLGNEVERMKGDVERLRNDVAGRAKVEEEREKEEGLTCASSDVRKCLDELRAEMKAEVAVLVEDRERRISDKLDELRREVEEGRAEDMRMFLDELRAEIKAEVAVLVEQRESRIFGKLDELRREVEEGRAEEAGRMRELSEKAEKGKAEVAGRLSEFQQRLDEEKIDAANHAVSALEDRERIVGLSTRLESFQEDTTRIDHEIQALWEVLLGCESEKLAVFLQVAPRAQKLPMAKTSCVTCIHTLDVANATDEEEASTLSILPSRILSHLTHLSATFSELIPSIVNTYIVAITGLGHEAAATDKGGASALFNRLSSMLSYLKHLRAALGELMPSVANAYFVLIHVYLAWSTVIVALWSLGVSQTHIRHCLHQQLQVAKTTFLKQKETTLGFMEHIMRCLQQYLLAARSALFKLKKRNLDFVVSQCTAICQAVRNCVMHALLPAEELKRLKGELEAKKALRDLEEKKQEEDHSGSSSLRKRGEVLRAEIRAGMAVLAEQREKILVKLDELRGEMEERRREVKEGRAEVAGRMKELREEVEAGKAEVAGTRAVCALDDQDRVAGLTSRLESFQEVTARIEGEIKALWEAFHHVGLESLDNPAVA